MRRAVAVRAAHVVVVIAGLLVCAYPFTVGAATVPTCRGVVMTPTSVCMKSDGSAGQTYAQRQATRRSSRPVVVGVGLLVAVFGTGLLVADLRRRPGGAVPGSAVEDAG